MVGMMTIPAAVVALLVACTVAVAGPPVPGVLGDGRTDDTAALQAALDKTGQAGGGVVHLPAGRYRINGALTIPSGVTLAGEWETPHFSTPAEGTTLLAYGGRGQADGPPLITLSSNSAVKGLTIYYPEQTAANLRPYPWTISGQGTHLNVSEVTLLNPYQGIDFSRQHEMHYVRNVYGCPLRTGIRVDRCTDIGRIENVHFNPNSWTRAGVPTSPAGPEAEKLVAYLQQNCVAFELGRSDWEFMFNTFSWGCKVGYRFFAGEAGPTNGNFLGIAADWSVTPLLVEQTQGAGLLITNGEFVGSPGSEAAVRVGPEHRGVVQLSNCSFWGPHERVALIEGQGTVSLSQCNFADWDQSRKGAAAVEARSGSVIVQACRFGQDRLAVRLGPEVASAVIMGNQMTGEARIVNESRGSVAIANNVVVPKPR